MVIGEKRFTGHYKWKGEQHQHYQNKHKQKGTNEGHSWRTADVKDS